MLKNTVVKTLIPRLQYWTQTKRTAGFKKYCSFSWSRKRWESKHLFPSYYNTIHSSTTQLLGNDMVLKLYGNSESPNARLVASILLEKDVPFELVDLGWNETRSPKYLDLQPFGQMPCIDDDGFVLYEGKAICHYLASKYPNQGTPLIPTELKANALFHQAVSVAISHFNVYVEKIIFENFYGPHIYKKPADKEVVDSSIKELGLRLDVYDHILSKQKYIAGDEITLADFYHIPFGTMLGEEARCNIIETKPNVARWFKEISSRPSWQAVKGGIKAEKISKL